MSRDDAPIDKDVCYEVRNKVFRIHFWTKEDALGFIDTTSPSEGYHIEKLQVFSLSNSNRRGEHSEPR
jgi:hypothetical protein